MYSIEDYTASEGQTTFTIPFPYIDEEHIFVYLNSTDITAYVNFNSPTEIVIEDIDIDTPAPTISAGDTVRIQRVTPIDEALVDFSNGSNLGESDLDTSGLQFLYVTQEAQDAVSDALRKNTDGIYDAGSVRITALGTPTDATDATTKAYVDAAATAAQAVIDAAETAALAAITVQQTTSVGAVQTQQTTSVGAVQTAQSVAEAAITILVTQAQTAETNAETAQTAAEVARDAALVAETNAELAETNAELAEVNAELAETNAEAAQVAAEAAQAAAEAAASVVNAVDNVGDLLVGNADNSLDNLVIGDEGKFLRVCTNQALKLRYERAGLPSTFQGLYMSDHPDHQYAKDKILMRRAACIVTDKGTVVTPRENLLCDVAVSGLGGIDSGSVSASAWYELYYVFKGQGAASPDDPTNPSSDGIVARKMGAYTTVENTTMGSTVALRDNAARTIQGQTFTATATGRVDVVEFSLQRTGTIAATTYFLWAEIYATSGGLPTGAALATSEKVYIEDLSNAGACGPNFRFNAGPTITNGTVYAVVLQSDIAISAANYITLYNKAGGSSYAGGSLVTYDGANWAADTAKDLGFRVHTFVDTTAVTLPSGYTEKCIIGYARTNSSSKWKPFSQQDREIRTRGNATTGVGNEPWLVNSSAVAANYALATTSTFGHTPNAENGVPPIPVLVELRANAASTGVDYAIYGRTFLKQLNIAFSGGYGIDILCSIENVASFEDRSKNPRFPIEHQRYMRAGYSSYGQYEYVNGFTF